MMMLRLATVLLLLSGCLFAQTSDCALASSISLYSDNPFDLQIFFDGTPAAAIPLRLYTGKKLMHTAVADREGRVRLGYLPVGEYQAVIPRKGTLRIVVRPQRSGLNGPLLSWFLFPESTYHWFAGKKVAGKPCPLLVLKED